MEQSGDNRFIPMTSIKSGEGFEVRPGVYYYTNQIVNVVMLGIPGEGEWVLIDAGMPKSGDKILKVANERFNGTPPAAIILTHGHFDHVGGIVRLLEEWNIYVYAHPLEFPFLTGQLSYPEPDSSVEGGLLAKISSIYPHEPIDIRERLKELPADGSIPYSPQWKWFHVPGHSPGQVALFNSAEKLLLSADAFVTVRQDSFYKVLIQEQEVNGPPRYLTTDWDAAWQSVRRLQALDPDTVIPGHGSAMSGSELKGGLQELVDNFDELAIPSHGKFVKDRHS